MEKREVRADYGDAIADMCGRVSGEASMANLPLTARPYGVVIMDNDGTRHSWHRKLPDEVRANNQSQTDIVVCISDEREEVVESCVYDRVSYGLTGRSVDPSQTMVVQRQQIYQDVFLLNPDTGAVIQTFRVAGSAPKACPSNISGESGDVKSIQGSDPEYEAFFYQLQQFIY